MFSHSSSVLDSRWLVFRHLYIQRFQLSSSAFVLMIQQVSPTDGHKTFLCQNKKKCYWLLHCVGVRGCVWVCVLSWPFSIWCGTEKEDRRWALHMLSVWAVSQEPHMQTHRHGQTLQALHVIVTWYSWCVGETRRRRSHVWCQRRCVRCWPWVWLLLAPLPKPQAPSTLCPSRPPPTVLSISPAPARRHTDLSIFNF